MRMSKIFVLPIFLAAAFAGYAQQAVVALRLGPAVHHAPQTAADWRHSVTLDHFWRENGESQPVTPTSASVAWDKAALYVRFICADPDPVFRDGVRVKRTDSVEVGLLPYGSKDLWRFNVDEGGSFYARRNEQGTTMQPAQVTLSGDAWTAEITIPWQQIGGMPAGPFRLQLSRNRFITGEVLSPSALDYHDGPAATDTFMEVRTGGTARIITAAPGLIALPSGISRWERSAVLQPATVANRKEIARLQNTLVRQPTTNANVRDRVRLAEIWYDELNQEGFSFHDTAGTWLLNPGEQNPWDARHAFNQALRDGDRAAAYKILDSLLLHFVRVSREWFADGTPGDVRSTAWMPVEEISSAARNGDEIVLHASAAGEKFDLHLSFLSSGGIRLHGPATGHFAPAAVQAFQTSQTAQGLQAIAGDTTVAITTGHAWKVEVSRTGNPGNWQIQSGDLRLLKQEGQITAVDLRGLLHPEEKIIGLGERFDALNQRGKTLTLWQLDAWDATARNGLSNQAYKPIPFWQNTGGYSIFWNSSYEMRADFGVDQANQYRVTADGPVFDLFVWPGDETHSLRSYTGLTGRPLLPPVWALEPWMGGGGQRWADDPSKTPAQTILDVAAHFHRLDIPHSAVYAEGQASSDPLLYRGLEPLNIHVLTWARSQPLGWDWQQIRNALPGIPESKLPVMRMTGGSIYQFTPPHPLADQFPYIDFTDPDGIQLLRAYWKDRLDLGVAGTMVDFGDLVPRNALFHDGSTGRQMHNWYVHGYDKAVQQVFRERRGTDQILFARGATAGTQAFVGQMAGDHASNFRGLDESITGGLSLCSSGFSNWGSDIGGYVGKPDEEVYLRWVEFGTFSPLMRAHGTEPREPWYYGEAAVNTYRKYAWVRENLLPYIAGSAQDVHRTGTPLMQALPLLASDEYTFGSDLLVAPVHMPGDQRKILLPAGAWTNLWTGAPETASTLEATVPIDAIPVFVRAGALLPVELAPDFKLGSSMSTGRIPALIVTPASTDATSHWWKLPDTTGPVMLRSMRYPDGFTLTVDNWHKLRYVLVLGLRSAVRQVAVNGQPLPQWNEQDKKTMPPGWEPTGPHTLLVRLPADQKQSIHFTLAAAH